MLDDDAMREKFVRDLDEMQALVQETLAYLRDELSGVSLELCDVNSLLDAWLADRACPVLHLDSGRAPPGMLAGMVLEHLSLADAAD